MRIKAVSGITCYVKDPKKTAAFYDKLGFLASKSADDRISVRSNWFWIDCIAIDKEERTEYKKEAELADKGAGIYVHLSVEDVDEFYEYVRTQGLKPESEPQNVGINREFLLPDPDGYKVVIFKRK